MSKYKLLRQACYNALVTLHTAKGIRSDFREDLKVPIALFRAGGETTLVEVMSYLVYVLRDRLRAHDFDYFKSDTFRFKLKRLFDERGLSEDVSPNGMAETFEYIANKNIDSLLTKQEYTNVMNQVEVLIENYMDYVRESSLFV